jgi:hypothetical protein
MTARPRAVGLWLVAARGSRQWRPEGCHRMPKHAGLSPVGACERQAVRGRGLNYRCCVLLRSKLRCGSPGRSLAPEGVAFQSVGCCHPIGGGRDAGGAFVLGRWPKPVSAGAGGAFVCGRWPKPSSAVAGGCRCRDSGGCLCLWTLAEAGVRSRGRCLCPWTLTEAGVRSRGRCLCPWTLTEADVRSRGRVPVSVDVGGAFVCGRWPKPVSAVASGAFVCGRWPKPVSAVAGGAIVCGRWPKPVSAVVDGAFVCERWPKPVFADAGDAVVHDLEPAPKGRSRGPGFVSPAALAGCGWPAVGFCAPASWFAFTFRVAVSRALSTRRPVTPKRLRWAAHL